MNDIILVRSLYKQVRTITHLVVLNKIKEMTSERSPNTTTIQIFTPNFISNVVHSICSKTCDIRSTFFYYKMCLVKKVMILWFQKHMKCTGGQRKWLLIHNQVFVSMNCPRQVLYEHL